MANTASLSSQEELEQALHAVVAERDELKTHLERVSAELKVCKVWAPPGHFYSPIVDAESPPVKQLLNLMGNLNERIAAPCTGIDIDESSMLKLFWALVPYQREATFPVVAQPGVRYHFENPAFSYSDALTYHGMIRHFKPKHIVEIGAGFSTGLMLDTVDRYLPRTQVTIVEPYPDVLLSLLPEGDAHRKNLIQKPLQEVSPTFVDALEANDILFIDSSHILKTGSDVAFYLFELFPRIKPGVLIHIHDIFYPFEYPTQWIIDENRSWNEAYGLRAVLQNSEKFKIIFFNDFFYSKYRQLVEKESPSCLKNTGGSIWLQKRH